MTATPFTKYRKDPFSKYRLKEEFADSTSINYYVVSETEFDVKKSVGNYPIFYCVLTDRVHFEMPIENAVIVFQKKFRDIYFNMNEGEKMLEDKKANAFIRQIVADKPHAKYNPSEEKIVELMRLS